MRKFFPILLFISLAHVHVKAQSLREYITDGLKNNIVLKEKTIAVDKAMTALKEAKSYFLPTTSFETQYTVAKGGRSIDMPIGDLLNPVYKTLNHMTGTDGFPSLKNSSEQLLPDNFYDVRIKTVMPIINPQIKINTIIKKQEIVLRSNDIDIYRRELVKDIKVAYYNYLAASEATHIFESALVVAKQNLQVNQSLLTNGKGLPAYISRASYEIQSVEGLMVRAFNERQNAKAYFNFLLNRSLKDSIIVSGEHQELPSMINIVADRDPVHGREELKSMTIALDMVHQQLRLNRAFRTPKVNGFMDLGMQDFNFKVNNNSPFYFAGLQLQIPIFSGKRNLYQIKQTQLDADNLSLQWEQVQNQLKLAATISQNNLQSAYSTYNVSLSQQQPAKEYYFLVERGYKEGVNSFVEFLDANRQLIDAQLQLNINKYKVLSALADYERETASYTFSRKNQ